MNSKIYNFVSTQKWSMDQDTKIGAQNFKRPRSRPSIRKSEQRVIHYNLPKFPSFSPGPRPHSHALWSALALNRKSPSSDIRSHSKKEERQRERENYAAERRSTRKIAKRRVLEHAEAILARKACSRRRSSDMRLVASPAHENRLNRREAKSQSGSPIACGANVANRTLVSTRERLPLVEPGACIHRATSGLQWG